LRDGEVVKFCSVTPHGSAILTLKSERQWSVDRPMPKEAEQVCAINGWQLSHSPIRLKNARKRFATMRLSQVITSYHITLGPMASPSQKPVSSLR
jgi:hypothetical protein